jgi:hypothetical protein
MTGLAIYFDLCDLRHDGLAAERVRHTASSEDVSFSGRFGGKDADPSRRLPPPP